MRATTTMMADRVHHDRLPRPAAICSPPTKKPSHTAPPAIKRASNLTSPLAPSAAAVLSRSFTSLNDDHRAVPSSTNRRRPHAHPWPQAARNQQAAPDLPEDLTRQPHRAYAIVSSAPRWSILRRVHLGLDGERRSCRALEGRFRAHLRCTWPRKARLLYEAS